MRIYKRFNIQNQITLYKGNCIKLLKHIPDKSIDLIITSPPYCMGKAYEDPHNDIETFKKQHFDILTDLYRVLKIGGSICWQIGYHVSNGVLVPLDYIVYQIFTEENDKSEYPLLLRNRIIWTFGHGLNNNHRFSGRHETILWFTKGEKYEFNLNKIRVPQKYPGKRFYKGPNKGKLSGNILGKNPSDIWDIPNVKAGHTEKTGHPCQFPVAIPRRLIRALVPEGGIVLDPFTGSGTSAVAAILEGCKFVGAEIKPEYYEIAINRINDTLSGNVKIRPDIPVISPNPNEKVATLPDEFAAARGTYYDEDN